MQQSFSSKARAFVAIDALEQDLRSCIQKYLLDHMTREKVFGSELPELVRRRDADSDGSGGNLTAYLYLRQAYDALMRHVRLLPRDLGDLLTANVGAMDGFVATRNRVMRGRPLQLDDLDRAGAFVQRFKSRTSPLLRRCLGC